MNERPDNQFNETLRALAEADAQHEAAPRVEAALLKAFRQQHAEENVTEKIASQPARGFAWSSLFAQWRPRWSYAVAAAALLFIGFAWWSWRAAEVAPKQKQEVAASSPTPVPLPAPMPAPIERIEQQRNQASAEFAAQRKPLTRRGTPKPAEQITSIVASGAASGPASGPASGEEEIATEFFPLVNENALPQRGQLRRVSVPRSTLINFGLPVNAERLEIPINADLLVGEDGAARAIRFVQDRSYGGRALPAAYRNPK